MTKTADKIIAKTDQVAVLITKYLWLQSQLLRRGPQRLLPTDCNQNGAYNKDSVVIIFLPPLESQESPGITPRMWGFWKMRTTRKR